MCSNFSGDLLQDVMLRNANDWFKCNEILHSFFYFAQFKMKIKKNQQDDFDGSSWITARASGAWDWHLIQFARKYAKFIIFLQIDKIEKIQIFRRVFEGIVKWIKTLLSNLKCFKLELEMFASTKTIH